MEITPRHIEQIEALHRYGSFRRAASKLCISQPALSRSILLLEEKLGVKFFDRAGGGLVLTPYGRIVLGRGESVLTELQLLYRDITMLRGGEQGVVNIGCGPIIAETFAGEAVARFNAFYPQMTVKITIDHASHLDGKLRKRSIDFFVGETHHIRNTQDYDMIPMPQQQGYFCCRRNHPLTALSPLAIGDVLRYPMALMWLPDRFFELFGKLTGRTIQKNEEIGAGLIECDNLNLLLRVVSGSDAVTLTSREIVAQSLHKEQVVLLPLVIPALKSGYAVVSLRGFTTIPAISYLKNLFLETAMQKVRKEGTAPDA